MAFFKTSTPYHYFSVFYYTDASDHITGAFHELTDTQYDKLKKLYSASTLYVGALFALQNVLMILDFLFGITVFPQAYVAFFLLLPIAPVAIAIFIAPKTKLPVVSMKMELDLAPTMTLYAMVILCCLAYGEAILWLIFSHEKMPGAMIWLTAFALTSLASLYRLIMVRRTRV